MEIHDFIAVRFRNDPKTYYAEVTGFIRDGSFKCRFVHSGSLYAFKQHADFLEVKESTGAFKPGTIVGDVTVFTQLEEEQLTPGANVGVTFDDGNSYLGVIETAAPLNIKFIHSGNSYSFDQDNVAHHEGFPYHGRRALAMKPYDKGESLFSGKTALFLNLRIKDEFGNPLRGEFEVKIQQSNPSKEIYTNSGLTAENSTAEDRLSIKGKENQELTLFLGFHPAVLPFSMNPMESSVIDRQTMISTTFPFRFDAATRGLNFEAVLTYDQTTVTAATRQEAVTTVFNQVTRDHSHSFGVKLEGEAGIRLFGIGGKLTGGGTTTDTDSSGSITGDTTADLSGGSTSTTWKVNYPKGLLINFSKN